MKLITFHTSVNFSKVGSVWWFILILDLDIPVANQSAPDSYFGCAWAIVNTLKCLNKHSIINSPHCMDLTVCTGSRFL